MTVANSTYFADQVAFNAVNSGNAETDASNYVPVVVDSKGNVIPPITSSQEAVIQNNSLASGSNIIIIMVGIGIVLWLMSGGKRGGWI
jgi:Ca2+/Na+ antiporter